MTDFVENTNL